MRANFLVSVPARLVSAPAKARPKGPRIAGPARCGRRTKALAKRMHPGDIAVIDHADLDSVAAQMLVEVQAAGVVNLSPSISGRYPNRGPSVLLEAGIPLLDVPNPELMDSIREGSVLEISGNSLICGGAELGHGQMMDAAAVDARLEASQENLDAELQRFARNTLDYASQELSSLLAPVHPPKTLTRMEDRHALVVVRGEGYKKDLQIIRGYLQEVRPVLIAVDGGADALLEMGLKPDIILGDMDSVSDKALQCGAELIVHAYADGSSAPGAARLDELGLEYKTFAVPGTSEDAAMLLAYEQGSELIVAVGTHSSLFDFLDKGRGGMASTILVRMRIGSRLVDARGVSKLYPSGRMMREFLLLLLVAVMLIVVIIQQSEPVQAMIQFFSNWIRMNLLHWRM